MLFQKYFQRRYDRQKLLEEVVTLINECEERDYHWILNRAAYLRPWRPRRTGWLNVLDQLLHAAYGAVLLLPVLLFHSLLGAALMGLLAGGIREIEQYFNQDLRIRMFWDRVLDTSAFVVGAVLIYYFLG